MTLFLVALFSSLFVVALFLFMAGVFLRDEQRVQVADYVRERKSVLIRLAELKKKAREKERLLQEGLTRKFEPPEDQKLGEDLHFLKDVAAKTPQVVATVIKTYLRMGQSFSREETIERVKQEAS